MRSKSRSFCLARPWRFRAFTCKARLRPTRSAASCRRRTDTARREAIAGSHRGWPRGFSFKLSDDSPVTFGLGVFGLVGGGVNFPGSTQTPILTPQLASQVFRIRPDLLERVSALDRPDGLVAAHRPSGDGRRADHHLGHADVQSRVLRCRARKTRFGISTFPRGHQHTAATGERGSSSGCSTSSADDWNLGFSYKSPIWQEKWDYNASTPRLVGRTIGIQAGLPEIISWGVAYKGLARTLIDVDLRYIDYANTPLFGTKVVDGGLGWQSVFAVAFGVQYKATDRLTLLGGYLYNTNPIRNEATLFNVQAPGIITNTLSLGASFNITEDITASLAWVHGFRNSIEGPILQLPGSSVRLDAQVDTLWMGFNVRFGRKKRNGPAETSGHLRLRRPSCPARKRLRPAPEHGAPDRSRNGAIQP